MGIQLQLKRQPGLERPGRRRRDLPEPPHHHHGLPKPRLVLGRILDVDKVKHRHHFGGGPLSHAEVVPPGLTFAVASFGEVKHSGLTGPASLVEEMSVSRAGFERAKPSRNSDEELIAGESFMVAVVVGKHG